MIRRHTLIAFIIAPLVVMLSLTTVNLASAHPASHLSPQQVAKKKPTITISNFMYTVPRRVAPGAIVRIVNNDESGHTVTADDGAFYIVAPGATTVRFRAPKTKGKYPFHCSLHPFMKSVLVVR